MFQLSYKSYQFVQPQVLSLEYNNNDILLRRFLLLLIFKASSYPFFSVNQVKFRSHNYIALLAFSFYIIAKTSTSFNISKTNISEILLRKSFPTFSLSKNRFLPNRKKSLYRNIGTSKHLSRLILLINLLVFFYNNTTVSGIQINATTPLCNIAHSMANYLKQLSSL